MPEEITKLQEEQKTITIDGYGCVNVGDNIFAPVLCGTVGRTKLNIMFENPHSRFKNFEQDEEKATETARRKYYYLKRKNITSVTIK